jgi:hypothetical protein
VGEFLLRNAEPAPSRGDRSVYVLFHAHSVLELAQVVKASETPYRPLKTGLRLPRNASIPSRKSSLM